MAEWEVISSATGIYSAGIAIHKNYFYTLGGRIGTKLTDEVRRLNLRTGVWEVRGRLTESKHNLRAFNFGDVICAVGGNFDTHLGFSRIVEVYNPENSQITKTIPYPEFLIQYGTASVGRSIYLLGGSVITGNNAPPKNHIYQVNIDTGMWIKMGISLPFPWTGMYAESIGSKIYLFGGLNRQSNTKVNDLYVFDTESNSIKQEGAIIAQVVDSGTSIQTHRATHHGVTMFIVLDGRLSMATYDTVERTWRISYSTPFPSNATIDAIIADDNYLYVTTNYSQLPTIQRINLSNISVVNPFPAAGFVNEHEASLFTWEITTNADGSLQQSYTFQWRVIGAAAPQSQTVTTSRQSHTIPTNTFPNGDIEWRVQVTASNGAVSEFTEWFRLTTIDERPLPPGNLIPNGSREDGTKPITFYWTHRSPLSTPQRAYEIQISYDGGVTWKVLSGKIPSSDGIFEAAANKIVPTDPAGEIAWRVRTYNSDDAASDWSEARFIVDAAPVPPRIISVTTGKSRITTVWESTGQTGWQLQVTGDASGGTVYYDSGQRAGEDKSHKAAGTYLYNGSYYVRVRIQNRLGNWSDWGGMAISVRYRSRLNVTLSGRTEANAAILNWETEVV